MRDIVLDVDRWAGPKIHPLPYTEFFMEDHGDGDIAYGQIGQIETDPSTLGGFHPSDPLGSLGNRGGVAVFLLATARPSCFGPGIGGFAR